MCWAFFLLSKRKRGGGDRWTDGVHSLSNTVRLTTINTTSSISSSSSSSHPLHPIYTAQPDPSFFLSKRPAAKPTQKRTKKPVGSLVSAIFVRFCCCCCCCWPSSFPVSGYFFLFPICMRCSPLRPLFIRCAFGGKAQNGQHKSIETARAKRFSCLVVVRETDPNSPVLYNGKCPVDIDCYTAPKKYVQHILRCNPWVLSIQVILVFI